MTSARGLAILYWTAVVAFALPLGLIVLTSLSDGTTVGFPIVRVSLRWYAAALGDPAYRAALALSVALAAGSSALAVAVGTWIALAAAQLRSRLLRQALLAGALVPLVTPGIIHAIALRIAILQVGLDPGPLAMLLGHAIHAAPFAAIMVGARHAAMPRALVDAASSLGAGSLAIYRFVVIPWLRPALVGAGMLAALTSFDDFIRSFFLGGYDATLPVLIFGRLRSGLTPEINAAATVVMAMGIVAGLAFGRNRKAEQA